MGTGGAGTGVMHRIQFSFEESNILGQGFGPSSTSLRGSARAEYEQLVTWSNRLTQAAIPEFTAGQAAPSHWYRRFADGRGALLYRVPEKQGRDRRGSRAKALVGGLVTPSMALMCATEGWLGGSEDLPQGWHSLQVVEVPDRPRVARINAALDSDALAHPGLVNLVTAVLNDPFSPVDVLAAYGTGLLSERDRLVLLWGTYRALYRVLGRASSPRFGGVDWSFSTYEPWPLDPRVQKHRPRIAFRPAIPGGRSRERPCVDLSALPQWQGALRDIAGWLTNNLNTDGQIFGEDEWAELTADPNGAYERVLDRLYQRVEREGMATGTFPRARVRPERSGGARTPPSGRTRTEPPDPARHASRRPEEPVTRTPPDRGADPMETTENIPPRRVREDPRERTEEPPPRHGAADAGHRTEEMSTDRETGDAQTPRLPLLLRAVTEARDPDGLERAVNGLVHLLNPGFMGELTVSDGSGRRQVSLTTTVPFLVAAGAALFLLVVCVVLIALLVS